MLNIIIKIIKNNNNLNYRFLLLKFKRNQIKWKFIIKVIEIITISLILYRIIFMFCFKFYLLLALLKD